MLARFMSGSGRGKNISFPSTEIRVYPQMIQVFCSDFISIFKQKLHFRVIYGKNVKITEQII
jgi:hypothetical protein